MHTSPTLCDASVRVGCHTGDITPSEFAIGTSKLIGALTTIRWGGACRCRRHDIAQSAVLTWIIVTRGHVEFASIPGKVLEDDIMNFGRKKTSETSKKKITSRVGYCWSTYAFAIIISHVYRSTRTLGLIGCKTDWANATVLTKPRWACCCRKLFGKYDNIHFNVDMNMNDEDQTISSFKF